MSILFFDPDVAGNPPCCKCSSNYVGLYLLSLLKLFDQVVFLHPSKWWSRFASAFRRPTYRVWTGYLHRAHGKVSCYILWLQSSCNFPSQLFRQLVYALQGLNGDSWEDMLSNFKHLVSDLYREWEDCLMQSLRPVDKTYFESICLKTATKSDLKQSLFELSYFLRRKFRRKVIVMIDECHAPNNHACEHDYFDAVRSLYPSLWPLALRTSNPGQWILRARLTFSSLEGDHYEIPLQNIL